MVKVKLHHFWVVIALDFIIYMSIITWCLLYSNEVCHKRLSFFKLFKLWGHPAATNSALWHDFLIEPWSHSSVYNQLGLF